MATRPVPASRHSIPQKVVATRRRSRAAAADPGVSAAKSDIIFLRERDLLQRLPFSHATLWRRVADGGFPAPVRISPRVVAWRLADVEAWRAGL